MITMTVNDLLNVIPVLRELLNKPFKGATAFKLARLMRELDKETTLFEESRQKIAEEYGKRDENDSLILNEFGNILIREDKITDCNNEMAALLNTSIEVNADKIPLEAFDEIDLAPAQAMAIDTLVDY